MTEGIIKKAKDYIENETEEYFKKQVQDLLADKNEKELNDRFYKDLDFGTGGMRGEIGGGLNRMNPYTIQRATQGLANYIKKAAKKDPKVVIAYDSRNFSDMFALKAALLLCANDITTYLFSALRPTPELSFAVRHLKATSGIVITASHNPKEYNGYKVYWDDGGQVVPPHDKGIIQEVRAVKDLCKISKEEALKRIKLIMIDKEIDDPFISMVKSTALNPELIRNKGKSVKVVYTPLHGSGGYPVSRALSEMGMDVIFVPEQKEPDGNFPTASFPNPEEAQAMEMSVNLGRKIKADLVMGTDPDADRLGIAVPDKNNDFILITGNQLGALLADYIFSSRKEKGLLPSKPVFIKTIVTTEFQRKIVEEYGALCIDVLTGFKYIGEKIKELEIDPSKGEFILGGEESYGYLIHTNARDKDAVSAATMTAEMALYHLSKGKSIMDRLSELWIKHGYYEEILISKYFKGQEGLETMNLMMDTLRKIPLKQFAGQTVLKVIDYKIGTSTNPSTLESIQDISLPSSDVLQFLLDDETIITARPSGTEPKIKFYASCCVKVSNGLETAKKEMEVKTKKIKDKISNLVAHYG